MVWGCGEDKWEDMASCVETVTVVRDTVPGNSFSLWSYSLASWVTISAVFHGYAYCLSQDPS